ARAPANKYACASRPCSRLRWSWRAMSLSLVWSLKDILDVFPNLLLNGSQRLAAVNDLNPLRFTVGEIEVALPDMLVKLQRLAFHAVEQFPAAGTIEADARVEVDHQRQVRHA